MGRSRSKGDLSKPRIGERTGLAVGAQRGATSHRSALEPPAYNRHMDAGVPIAERLDDLVERLQPLRPSRILLFGSAARGETDQLSDIDVIVVADQVPPKFLDRLAEAYDLIDPHYALDIFVYTPDEYERMRGAENPLIEAAEASGRVLYERSAA